MALRYNSEAFWRGSQIASNAIMKSREQEQSNLRYLLDRAIAQRDNDKITQYTNELYDYNRGLFGKIKDAITGKPDKQNYDTGVGTFDPNKFSPVTEDKDALRKIMEDKTLAISGGKVSSITPEEVKKAQSLKGDIKAVSGISKDPTEAKGYANIAKDTVENEILKDNARLAGMDAPEIKSSARNEMLGLEFKQMLQEKALGSGGIPAELKQYKELVADAPYDEVVKFSNSAKFDPEKIRGYLAKYGNKKQQERASMLDTKNLEGIYNKTYDPVRGNEKTVSALDNVGENVSPKDTYINANPNDTQKILNVEGEVKKDASRNLNYQNLQKNFGMTDDEIKEYKEDFLRDGKGSGQKQIALIEKWTQKWLNNPNLSPEQKRQIYNDYNTAYDNIEKYYMSEDPKGGRDRLQFDLGGKGSGKGNFASTQFVSGGKKITVPFPVINNDPRGSAIKYAKSQGMKYEDDDITLGKDTTGSLASQTRKDESMQFMKEEAMRNEIRKANESKKGWFGISEKEAKAKIENAVGLYANGLYNTVKDPSTGEWTVDKKYGGKKGSEWELDLGMSKGKPVYYLVQRATGAKQSISENEFKKRIELLDMAYEVLAGDAQDK